MIGCIAFFVDGVFNLVIVWLFEACIQSGMPQVYQVCSDYISKFVWPRRLHATHLHEIFTGGEKISTGMQDTSKHKQVTCSV